MFSLLDDIKQNIPNELSAQILSDFLIQAEKCSNDTEFITDSNSAKEFAEVISSLLVKYSKEPNLNADIQNRLKNLEIKLRWLNPSDLESNYRKELMSNGVVRALRMGIDVLGSIRQYLFIWENEFQPDDARRADLIYNLINNQETIGSNQINLSSGDSVLSSVQNWLKDYLSSLSGSSLGGSFEKVNYLTQNLNVKKLNSQEKEILTKVLDIYQYLKNPQGNFAIVVPDEEAVSAPSAGPKAQVSLKQSAVPSIPVPPKQAPKPIAVPVPAPVAAPIPVKPVSAFDQKLAQVSAPPPHGESLEMLKSRLEEVKPAVVASAPIKPSPPTPLPKGEGSIKLKMTPAEIKREVATTELPEHKQPILPAVPKPVALAAKMPIPPAPASKPVVPQVPKPVAPKPSSLHAAPSTLPPISVMDDLKKIDIRYLRAGALPSQVSNLKSAILNLAHANNMIPFYAVQAFEQSPLFQSYLAHGSSIFGGGAANADLSQEEFEAVADLRNELERM